MRRFLRMGAAVATLCWGNGVVAQTAPVPIDPADWITHDDYPTEAVRQNLSGTVEVEVTVDANGAATGCSTVKSSGSPILDKAVCTALLPRARFKPARDARGRATGGTYMRRVHWEMPDPLLEPLSPYAALGRFTVGPDGKIATCKSQLAGDLMAGFDVCVRFAESSTLRETAGRYGPGTLIYTMVQSVEGMPRHSAAPTPDIPLKYWVEQRFRVDAAGHIITCTTTSSMHAASTCKTPMRYTPRPGGTPVEVVRRTVLSFRPAR